MPHTSRPTAQRLLLVVAVTLVAAALTLLVGALKPDPAVAASSGSDSSLDLTVLGTADVHGYVRNWDYFRNAHYEDGHGSEVGFAKLSALIDRLRAERGRDRTLLLDAGDTIQGTPLTQYYAKVEPITKTGAKHPIAAVMNAMRYDVMAVGNHEFNYGIPLLRAFEQQLEFPILGANVLEAGTQKPAFKPYVMRTVQAGGRKPVNVGVLGLTTPGSAVWDRAHVEGRLNFADMVETAREWVPRIKAAGADVVVVNMHSGIEAGTRQIFGLPPLNAGRLVAENVPDIDAVLTGHSHQDIPEVVATNQQTGKQVVLATPWRWGSMVAVIDLQLELRDGAWTVVGSGSSNADATAVAEDPRIVSLAQPYHDTVLKYVNTEIGNSSERMTTERSRFEDTPALDLINEVQTEAVRNVLAGGPHATKPILSIAAPFTRTAVIPQGPVSIRDVASLYIYDNTLLAVDLTGSQLKDYLERSAEYFTQQSATGTVDPDTLTNAGGQPDYNFDALSGVDYDIDVSRPVGQRIVKLSRNGLPVGPNDRFVLAINNYRQGGGGNFPHVAAAPVLVNNNQEVRQLIVDWISAKRTLSPADFFVKNWRLVRGNQELVIP